MCLAPRQKESLCKKEYDLRERSDSPRPFTSCIAHKRWKEDLSVATRAAARPPEKDRTVRP